MKKNPTPTTPAPEPFAMTEAYVLRGMAARRNGWVLPRKV